MAESKGRRSDYEAMVLISQAAAADLGAAVEHITEIFKKADAELIAMRKWDERRLAFEIEKQKRGTYLLAYFSSDPVKVAAIERLFNLSETVLRFMIVKADHLTRDEMLAADARSELATEIELRRSRQAEESKQAEQPAGA